MPSRSIASQVTGSSLVTSSAQIDLFAKYLSVHPHQLQLTLLFTSTADGWNPSSFHAKCDSQGATLTLVRRGDRYYGGYAHASWLSNNKFVDDPQAFLFRFTYQPAQEHIENHEKFESSRQGKELYGQATYGPTFGQRFDLFTFADYQQSLTDVHNEGVTSFVATPTPFYDASATAASQSVLEVLKVSFDKNIAEELEEAWVPRCSWTVKVSCNAKGSSQCTTFYLDPQLLSAENSGHAVKTGRYRVAEHCLQI